MKNTFILTQEGTGLANIAWAYSKDGENNWTEFTAGDDVDLSGASSIILRAMLNPGDELPTLTSFKITFISLTSDSEDYAFTGKEKDTTGLYYFGARYYDPEAGEFISEDPGQDGTNWYRYCASNPLKYIDPDGKAKLVKINDFFGWHYSPDDRYIDSSEAIISFYPFGGFIVDWVSSSPYQEIDLHASNSLVNVLKKGNHVLGSLSNFIKGVKYVSVTLQFLNYVDTALSGGDLLTALVDPSKTFFLFGEHRITYKVQEAVYLTHLLYSKDLECLKYMSIVAEQGMERMLNKGFVKLNQNKYGVYKLKIINKEAFEEYTQLLILIRNNWK